MAKNKQPKKERKCRKNIATLLLLMGFKDDNPAATIKTMRAKLKQIQEKAKFKKPPAGHSTFNKPTFNKLTFKCGGKRRTVFLKQPSSFGFTVGDVCHLENKKKTTNNDVDHHQDSAQKNQQQQQMMKKMELKINGHDNHMEIEDSRNNVDQMMNDDDDDGGCMGLHVHSFITSMGGSEARLVIQKQLTSSDVNKSQGRLLMPRMNVKNSGFLTSAERRKLGNKQNISVPVFDLERRELTVNLAQWTMNKEVYVLKTGWNDIVKANGLEKDLVIRVWAFRVNERLCFALAGV